MSIVLGQTTASDVEGFTHGFHQITSDCRGRVRRSVLL